MIQLDDNNPVLESTPEFNAKIMQKIKYCGNWLLGYIPPKPTVAEKGLESFRNLMKKVHQERHFLPIERFKICVKKSLRYSIE